MDKCGNVDWNEVASVLGVDRGTLPGGAEQCQQPVRRQPKALSPADDYRLTDEEWAIIEPHFPRGVVRRSLNDRGFLDGVIWRQRMKGTGKSWWYVPTECGVPVPTMRGRFARWCEWGWWERLSEALRAEGGLSDRRKLDFLNIAAEASDRRASILAGRND